MSKTNTKLSNRKAGKRKRLPMYEKEVRWLGLECENVIEADAILKKRKSLQDILKEYPRLQRAWDHGRFLRNLRDLARKDLSISKAAKRLGFESARDLQALMDEDEEVGELWKNTKFQVYIDRKLARQSAILEGVKKGDPDAIRAAVKILKGLREEKEQAGADLSRLSILQLTGITRRTRRTILEWHTKFGMPRNADGTFDFKTVFKWFENFLLERASAGKG